MVSVFPMVVAPSAAAATPAMLLECADLVFQCAGGEEVLATRFNCLACCDVLRHLRDDVGFAGPDAAGRAVVPLHDVDAAPVRLAVDLLHGVRTACSLGADELDLAYRGFDVLGSGVLVPALNDRLWRLVGGAVRADELLPHAARLLADPAQQVRYVSRLMALEPLWGSFSRRVLPALASAHPGQAGWLLGCLADVFPMNRVAAALLDLLPAGTTDACASLVSCHGGHMYHPAEVPGLLKRLVSATTAASETAQLCRAMLEALQTYDPAPASATPAHGSVLEFPYTQASALVTLEPSKRVGPRHKRVRVSPWLQLELTPHDDGGVDLDAHVRLRTLAPRTPRRPTAALQVRVLVDRGDAPDPFEPAAETWYVFGAVPWHGPGVRLEQAETRLGSAPALVRRALRESSAREVRTVRVDVFYGAYSVLLRPLGT